LTIYGGVFFANLIIGFAEWVKKKQEKKVVDEVNKEMIRVFRGNNGIVKQISVRDIVVGDVIDIQ
jgi:magnesium-transporting ATPase (P-type)